MSLYSARKHDERFTLSAEERVGAVTLLMLLKAKAKENPWLRPCINLAALRDEWPLWKDVYKGVIE